MFYRLVLYKDNVSGWSNEVKTIVSRRSDYNENK